MSDDGGIERLTEELKKRGLHDALARMVEQHGVTVAEALSRRRPRRIAEARRAVCVDLYQREKLSLIAIARLLGLHHTSVLAALDVAGVPRRQRTGGRPRAA